VSFPSRADMSYVQVTVVCTVDPGMNGLKEGVGGPIMPIVRYFQIVYIYIYIYI
jgi:acyl-CoA reductase-like NAD-dependent aldehyde dehydrogenase